MAIVGEEYCSAEERVLTVRKTSHFSPGDGFAAYDHRTGGLAFRADTYGRGHGGGAASAGELALLGPAGEALITVRRRRPSLHQRWEGYLGARADGQKPLFSARRSSILGGAAAGAVVELLAPLPASSSSTHAAAAWWRLRQSQAGRRAAEIVVACIYCHIGLVKLNLKHKIHLNVSVITNSQCSRASAQVVEILSNWFFRIY